MPPGHYAPMTTATATPFFTELAAVAGKTRHMPDDFLKPGANQLSEAGMAYLRRLVPAKYKVGKPFV